MIRARVVANMVRCAASVGAMVLPASAALRAQQPPEPRPPVEALTVSGDVPADRFVDRHSAITFSLSRPLLPDEGEVSVMIGSVDVTDLVERTPTKLVYRPTIVPLPAGERDIVIYRRAGGRWTELGKFALKVLRRGGITKVSLSPAATLGNTGQLAEGRSAGIPEPARPTFQDFTLTSALRSAHEAVSWSLETQTNVVGASRQELALRFGERGRDAPQVDLSDYRVTMRASRVRFALGHVSVGANRHLINGFASRGVTVSADMGPAALSIGALNGSSIVGWDDLIGLDEPDHRVLSAALGGELIPARPGTLRVDLSLLDGSLLPRTSFTQGAVVDAERSTGAGVQVTASTPDQRLRFVSGYARSRFNNPNRDPQLTGDSTIRRVRPETRGTRFVEVNAAVVRAARLPAFGAVTLNTAYRHERVDPLYRSVAASTQADRQQQAWDVSGGVGLVAGQLSLMQAHDNLDDVPSVLRTLTSQSSASFTVPLSSISRLGRRAALLPMLTYASSRIHQQADGVPTNGDFRPTDLPDQVSTSHNAAAQWQVGRWRLGLRYGLSEQDNRQALRERADFTALVHAITAGITLGAVADVSVDVSSERQHAKERDETSRASRLGMALNWRLRPTTGFTAAVSSIVSRDASRPTRTRNSDMRLEASQVLNVRGAQRGQLFLRYGRNSLELPNLVPSGAGVPANLTQQQWTLSSGLSLRLF